MLRATAKGHGCSLGARKAAQTETEGVGGRSWPWEGGSENVLDRGKSTHSGSKSEQTSTSGERRETLRKVTLAALSLSFLVTAWDAFPGSHVAGYPSSSWFTPRLLKR